MSASNNRNNINNITRKNSKNIKYTINTNRIIFSRILKDKIISFILKLNEINTENYEYNGVTQFIELNDDEPELNRIVTKNIRAYFNENNPKIYFLAGLFMKY